MNCKEYLDGIEWVWFDLDDTLYDFGSASLVSLKEVYDQCGLDRFFASLQDWIDRYHQHNPVLWELYNHGKITQEQLRHDRFYLPLVEVGTPLDEVERLNPILDRLYLESLGRQNSAIEGAVETVDALRRVGLHIGILSNGFCGVQHEKLKSLGIIDKIDCIVLSDEISVNKPDRRLYDYALQKSGATAANSLMVGDNPATDIAGALAAGWRAMLFGNHDVNPYDIPSAKTLADVRKLIID
jgi:putative hydrolase of the HAD superfamily